MKLLVLFFLVFSLYATTVDKLTPFMEAQAFFNNDEYEKAFPLFLKCTDKSHNSELAYKLGWMYQNAKGVVQNHQEAARWYKKAAEWEVAKTNKKKLYQTIFSNMSPLSDNDSSQTALKLISGKFALRAYEPNYLMVTYSDTPPHENQNSATSLAYELQYQISLRADYVTDWFGASQIWSGAYTQTSFWQIFLNSSPFRETNYKPELFVTFPLLHKADIVGLKGVVFGYKHSSNGQPVTDGNRTRPDGPIEGSRSRSWNRLYVKTYFQWGNFFSTLNVWHRIVEDRISDDNPDIEEYYGQGSVSLTYIHKKLLLSAKINPSIKKGVASAEVSLSYPTLVSEDVYFYLQVFSGYGSSLIDYDQKINRIGFGLSISR